MDAHDDAYFQVRYSTPAAAQGYRRRYETSLTKRLTTRRELQLLTRILARLGRSKDLLDVPCGNGRISATLAASTDRLIEADIGLGQVQLGRQLKDWQRPTTWLNTSIFQLPFRDDALEGVVCNRLSHHLSSREAQERVLAELLRVSRRFVVLSFFDYFSQKNLWSLLCNLIGTGPRRQAALSVKAIALWAARHGGQLVASPRLFPVGSGQRYAVLLKMPAPKTV